MSQLPPSAIPLPPRKAPLQRGLLENAKKAKPFRIFDFLWRRGPLILGICIPIALILVVLVSPFATSSYRVEGTLLIKPIKEPMINGGVRDVIQGDVGYFQRTLAIRLSDVGILREAIESLPVAKRPKFIVNAPNIDRAAYSLLSRMRTREMDRTYLIQVSLEDSDPEGLAEMLSAVMESLVTKLHREQERQYESRLTYLHGERDKITGRAGEEKTRILKFAETVDNKSFLHDAYTAHLGKVEVIQRLYWEAVALAVEKQALYTKALADQRDLEKFSLEPFAQERVTDNFGINQIEQWTYGKSQELRSNIDGLTPNNPDRKYVEARMASMNEYLSSYKKTVGDATILNLSQKRQFELETEVAKTKNGYEAAQSSASLLQDQLNTASLEASKISEAIFLAKDMNYGIGQLRERLASISTRIDDAELEAKSPLPVSIDQMPVKPGTPDTNNAGKLRMMILVATFGLVGGLCVVFDFLDGRIRSREEIAAAIGGPGAEPIPWVQNQDADFRFADWVMNNPEHPAALSMRDLALRLSLEHERSDARIIAFAGLHFGAGNTSIAIAASRTLANHGWRVLHVEAPTPHPGLKSSLGLQKSILGEKFWKGTEKDPLGYKVSYLPWDPACDPLRARTLLVGMLENPDPRYDLIVLDLPPLETSDLANETSLKSDVVVLTGRQEVATFPAARRAVEWLAAGSVPAITVLLNFASPNTMRERVLGWVHTGQKYATRFHELFNAQIKNRAAAIKANIAARRSPKT